MKFRKFWMLIIPIALMVGLIFAGCGGSDGSNGKSAYQIAVENGFTGTEQEWLDSLAGGGGTGPGDSSWFAEYCTSCHQYDPAMHQASYNDLYQGGIIEVTNLAYAYSDTIASSVVTFEMDKFGNDFDCLNADSLGIYFSSFNGTGFDVGRQDLEGTVTYSAGVCTSVIAGNDLTGENGIIVVYGRDETVASIPGTRVNQEKYPFAAVATLGTVTYDSPANVSGCELCHTVPYLKHGYIFANVGDPALDFYTCKACHLDEGEGGHFIWQLLVDDPQLIISLENQYGEDWEESGAASLDKYAYKTRLMNDVHMSHAMEFPYPQSMSNCATCHTGDEGDNLGAILTEANFTLETCKSCHPVTGDPQNIMDAPALFDVMPTSGPDHTTFIDPVTYENNPIYICATCHSDVSAQPFASIHTGYDPVIYTDTGTKISGAITVSIDGAALNGYMLSISFSATGTATNNAGIALDSANIKPAVLVGLYGQNTKDFLVGPHASDVDTSRNLEFDVVGSAGGTDWNTHPRYTVNPASTPGSWIVTANLTHWASLINDGTIQRAEIAVTPELKAIVGLDDASVAGSQESDDYVVALNAPSRTFDLAPAPGAFDDGFYADIVDVAGGCNNCHDALATTFHDPDRGGNIVVCRLCHITLSGGSHLEMQSRSIDSYVHAIHSFQPFNVGRALNRDGIDFTDPVEEMHYEHHIGFVFPTFGLTDCLACHATVPGIPTQAGSMPGLLSPSGDGVLTLGWEDRQIQGIPESVTGPAGRACGGCHKVEFINEDDAAGLADFNQHIENYGYLWENDSNNVILGYIIDTVFSVFAP